MSGAAAGGRELDAEVRWDAVGEEALDLLRCYLRFPTVNDPERLSREEAELSPWAAGDESEAAEWLAGILRAEGIEHEVLEAAPRRKSVLARLSGRPGGRPITLLSHSDVVPAIRSEWGGGRDPFGAAIDGGYVYGRGALDLKGLGIGHLMVLLLLHRLHVPLRRDVVLLVAADEETGGRWGTAWVLERRRDLLGAGAVVFGEGAYSLTGAGRLWDEIQAVSIAEKGVLEIELRASGRAHHASMPDPDSAPARLTRALSAILSIKHQVRLTPPTEALLAGLAAHAGGLHGLLLRRPRLAAWLAPSLVAHGAVVTAMLKDTCALTILDSGTKSNVVPGSARAVLSARLLPGSDRDALLERLHRAIADPMIELRVIHEKPPTATRLDTPALSSIRRHASSGRDGVLVVPIISPGASDARFFRLEGVDACGRVPFPIPPGDLQGVHGPDERVSVQSFQLGIRALFAVVAELATAAA